MRPSLTTLLKNLTPPPCTYLPPYIVSFIFSQQYYHTLTHYVFIAYLVICLFQLECKLREVYLVYIVYFQYMAYSRLSSFFRMSEDVSLFQ